jgi:Protein of unknown function (DUF3228)
LKKVACGEFVKRQTKDSGYSHFDGTWEELEALVEKAMSDTTNIRNGYKDGVILVDLDAKRFRSAIVNLTGETKLSANYAARRPGEGSYIRLAAKGKKQPAIFASVVLYSKEVLEENNERETGADWEIVAIKARVSFDEEPMDPTTMARNFLHLPGGTKGDFTAEQFAQSIVYWNHHCMTMGKRSLWNRITTFFKRLFV